MPAKKYNQTAPVKILWGDRTLQAAEFADEPPAHRIPDANDPEWNELVDDVILQSRTTDQTLLSNLEITGAGKKFIAGDGSTRGFYLKNTASINRGLGKIIGSGATESMEVMELFGKPAFRQVPGFGEVDYSAHTARSVNLGDVVPVPEFAAGGGTVGYDGVNRFLFAANSDTIGSVLKFGLFAAFDVLNKKFGGFNEFGGNIQSIGIPAPTRILEGTGTNAALLEDGFGSWTRYTTGNASGNRAGVRSAAFDMFRKGTAGSKPFFGVRLRKLSPFTLLRLWIVLTSAEIGATDDPAATHLIGLRYSTTTDANLKAVSKDGTTLNVQEFNSPGVIDITLLQSVYILWPGAANPIVVIDDGVTLDSATLSVNLPSNTVSLGFQVTLETKTAATRNFDLKKVGLLES